MNELDLLKKHWQKADKNLPKYSYEELYKMLHKKSSSLVKWILYISIIEFAIWGALYFIVPEGSNKFNKDMGLTSAMLIGTVLSFVVFGLFIFLFYYNYSRIRITDSIKELMQSILRTRRTVYFFIIWNIASAIITLVLVSIHYSRNKERLVVFILEQNPSLNIDNTAAITTGFFIGFTLTAVVIIGVMLLLYRIVYIRLLKRLKANYKQLQEINENF